MEKMVDEREYQIIRVNEANANVGSVTRGQILHCSICSTSFFSAAQTLRPRKLSPWIDDSLRKITTQ